MPGGRGFTFFAFSESLVASMVMYFSPLTLTPSRVTCLGSLLSEKESMMALSSLAGSCWVGGAGQYNVVAVMCGPTGKAMALPRADQSPLCAPELEEKEAPGWVRTLKPADVAQTVPSRPAMRALSMLPVPRRLLRMRVRDGLTTWKRAERVPLVDVC